MSVLSGKMPKLALRALVVAAALCAGQMAQAQTANQVESYKPSIWIDPDGCEHWVMDDGFEGFMSPHLRRDGTPVCRTVKTCAILRSEALFATDSDIVGPPGRKWLLNFFRTQAAASFVIEGHTDSRASDEYNLELSSRRARAVADIAIEAGATVSGIRAYGERKPRASNATPEGMQQNRRVEIMCAK
jgi:outer membrane protein OmpA-like peptidoglycan-associated protein